MKHKLTLKSIFYTILVLLTLSYIIFRIFFTLPLKLGFIPIICSIIVLLIEFWDALDFFTYYFNVLLVPHKKIEIPSFPNTSTIPDIDILIATINESEAILSRTINSCKNLEYPDKTKLHIYICDDGNRSSIRKLADNLGINYLSRTNNSNAKAGNYNHALKNINSPYLATFDADMAPTPNFLMTTLPFFLENKNNDKIGFIQLPQSFINPDIFQHRFNLQNKIPFEQDYFYHRIQLSKNATNSAIYCGTNTLFLRKALDNCNGFSTGTISEDFATGMMIESKGYSCLALNEIAAYGISVNDVSSFIKQRSRWGRGCIQILKKFKISKIPGLTFRQKLEYLSSISYWYFGFKRIIYLLAPLLFSIFGIIIIDCNLKLFVAFWLPAYILKRFTLDILEKNHRSSTWTKIYETILAPSLCIATLKETFGFGNTKFEVSSKNITTSKKLHSKEKIYKKVLYSHLILLIANIIGLIMCLLKINTHITIYALSILWLISNIFYLTVSIIFDIGKPSYIDKNFEPNKIKKYNKLSIFKIFKLWN